MVQKRLLLIGIDPALITFPRPQERNAATVTTARVDVTQALEELGHEVHNCLIDLGDTAEAAVSSALQAQAFDIVMIGAHLRAQLEQTVLFERIINLVHRQAPQARLCFNTRPDDTLEAVQRWL